MTTGQLETPRPASSPATPEPFPAVAAPLAAFPDVSFHDAGTCQRPVVPEQVSCGNALRAAREAVKGVVVIGSLSTIIVLSAIPSEVIWSYSAGAVVLAAWLVGTVLRGDWSRARGFDKLTVLGPLFYAVPLAAFGTEHFTFTDAVASLIPAWIPWHRFLAYLVGACFVAAALSLVTKIQARLAASLLAATFFLFVVLMDLPAWAQDPRDRFALTLALRQLAFSGGALALAASLIPQERERGAHLLARIARYFVAIPVLVFGVEQFMHGDHVPGVPLNRVTPEYVLGHGIWTYLTALVYVLAGVLLLAGKKTQAAASWVGLTVLLLVLVVYVPIAVVERASIGNGLNYLFDTLMFCGAVLLLAGAMPREEWQRESSPRAAGLWAKTP